MDIKKELEHKKILYQELQKAKENQAYRKQYNEPIKIITTKPIHSTNRYNYKIKETGSHAEAIIYEEPILTGYQRKHTPTRKVGRTMANEQNAKRARKNVYDLVNTNYTEFTKMITLTYAETMLDYDQLYMDWKRFVESLKRKGIKFPYLAITEHQLKRGKREGNEGSLHVHAILFTNEYIPFKTLKACWGTRGSVHIEKIDKASNKGAYVAKYITKDAMPPDKKSYRTSRNIKRPTVRVGLGDEIDVITSVKTKGFGFVSQTKYTKINGANQETGEIKEDTIATIMKFDKK